MLRHDTGGFAASSPPEGFDLKDFEEAGLRVVERRFEPKDLIFAPGDPDDQLYFLLSGVVRLYKIYGDYKEATTALLKDRGIFGKLSLVEGRWQDVFAEAVTEARVAAIQKAAIEQVIKTKPDFALKLFSSLSERLRQSDEVIESLLHREVSTRLATLLLNLGERFGREEGGRLVIEVRMTHQDLANMIASTREAVSKVMSEFQREGLIETRNRRIALLNREALAERAAGPTGLV
ncbi:transcriptional regulator, Crp/Fnr family [Rubrobacter xylanophilus DSM 9941]|uniref:Transcriptional regulator, Crp/Fnr family n=1 Tax=Rubrobacter xylanophilus (strain DSM 9941 / JCM 11954 / NBRC 16129 / PRD-1) TaxID=266117 RepID=Q1AXQ1_RUBXD|nr:Crp/Fnr family transcriptional regulator [Rubrobacter xylanophilus]ABG03827.1 transcriptional regulator, Crp/Fnr family [Rubrobacter xylanophilus DSM 9941]